MKIILIALFLFKISSSAPAEKNPNNCVYKRPNNSSQASTLTEYYCNSFDLRNLYTISLGKSDAIIKQQECYDKCIATIKPYLKKVDENKNSIDKFHNFCEDFDKDALYCGKIINHFKIWCFNMDAAVDLLRVVDRKTYMDTPDGYTRIAILYKDWNEFKNIGNVNILNCLFKFTKEKTKYATNVLHLFKEWFDMDNNSASQCNCIEIFAIYNIYNVKEFNLDQAARSSMLQKYFQTFCLPTNANDIEKLHIWSSKQFKAISEYAKITKLEYIRLFLFEGTRIAEAKWFIADVSSKNWNFDYMIQQIRFDEKGYQSRINLISVALNCMMSITDYEEFRDGASGDKDCVTLGCWIGKLNEYKDHNVMEQERFLGSHLLICMKGIRNFENSKEILLP